MNSFGLDDTKLTKTTILAVFCIPASQFCFIKCINRKKKNQFEKSGEDVQNDCQLFFIPLGPHYTYKAEHGKRNILHGNKFYF